MTHEYYDTNAVREWNRLFSDQYHQVEYQVTLHYLDKFLPTAGHILDAGGGPGRYTIYLANKGNKVTLADISSNELMIAKAKIAENKGEVNRESVVAANILDLPFSDNTFTATVALGGVLSHLVHEQERRQALLELSRVTVPDGYIFISVMNRLGEINNILSNSPGAIYFIDQFLTDGDHRRLTTGEYTGTHFYTPHELNVFVRQTGMRVELIASLQNIASPLRHHVNKLSPGLFQQWLKVFIQLSQEPSLLGVSSHLLVIARNQK